MNIEDAYKNIIICLFQEYSNRRMVDFIKSPKVNILPTEYLKKIELETIGKILSNEERETITKALNFELYKKILVERVAEKQIKIAASELYEFKKKPKTIQALKLKYLKALKSNDEDRAVAILKELIDLDDAEFDIPAAYCDMDEDELQVFINRAEKI